MRRVLAALAAALALVAVGVPVAAAMPRCDDKHSCTMASCTDDCCAGSKVNAEKR